MFCRKCGMQMDADAAFCVRCGTPQTSAVPKAAQPLKVSPSLGFSPAQDLTDTPKTPDPASIPGFTPVPVQPPVPDAPPTPGYGGMNPPGYGYSPAAGDPSASPYPPVYSPVYPPVTGKPPMAPDKKKKVILFSVIGGVALVLVAVLLLLFLGGRSGFSSAEEAAEAFVIAKVTHDGEAYVDCLHDFYIRRLGEQNGMDKNISREYMAEIMQYTLDKKVVADCRVLSADIDEYAQESDYEYIKERKGYFRYLTDREYDSISNIVKVEVIYVSNGTTRTNYVTCIEMSGRWYVYP